MRDADLAAPDRRHVSDSEVLERIAKGIFTDHSRRANDYEALLARRRNIHARLRGAAKAIRLVVIITEPVPQSSRRRAGAQQIAKRRRSSRTGPHSGERRSSAVAFHRRSLGD